MADWTKIQIEYEQGIKPKELAEKYGLTAQQISRKATSCKWINPNKNNKRIVEKSRENRENEIDILVDKSFTILNNILNNEDAKTSDKINAIKCVIDISGLKKDNKDLNVNNNFIEVRFI